jgi:hypothetical protein
MKAENKEMKNELQSLRDVGRPWIMGNGELAIAWSSRKCRDAVLD